eukprot:Nk52_evm2s1524 gene=Nk52_evmTU2s1524
MNASLPQETCSNSDSHGERTSLEAPSSITEGMHSLTVTEADAPPTTSLNANAQIFIPRQLTVHVVEETDPSKRPCLVFKRSGKCRFGKKCKYSHDISSVGINTKANTTTPGLSETKTSVVRASQLAELPEFELQKLKETELFQIQRRFRGSFKTIQTNDLENADICEVTFSPSDPDWPYTMDTFVLRIILPEFYPRNECIVSFVEQEGLPEVMRRWMNKTMMDHIHRLRSINGIVLLFRPFLKWLHKNIEDLFTKSGEILRQEQTLQQHGIQFVHHTNIKVERDECATPEVGKERGVQEEVGENVADSEEEKDEDASSKASGTNNPSAPSSKIVSGTEIVLKELLLTNVGILQIKQLQMTVSCQRCRVRKDVAFGPTNEISFNCSKCKMSLSARFKPLMVHEHSLIAGHLEMLQCLPFDVLLHQTVLSVSCLECSKAAFFNGVQRMSRKEINCVQCHTKMEFQIGGILFRQNQSFITDKSANFKSQKTALPPKKTKAPEEFLVVGEPLPRQGACKHYKKSRRWFRFPCCGKLFPCDKCHEKDVLENQKGSHDEMKLANRMVCGFCSREQVFSDTKPCQCGAELGPGGKTAFWEGGKGCRNTTTMARNEKKKFVGLNKTASKKSERVGSSKAKKRK